MTAQVVIPVDRMEALEEQIRVLEQGYAERVYDIMQEQRRRLDPLKNRLRMLQRRCLTVDELVAEHKALQLDYWAREERVAGQGGWKEADRYQEDDEQLAADREESQASWRRFREIEAALEVLGHDSKTRELAWFRTYPPEDVELRIERARWLIDLRRWPKAFQVRLEPYVRAMTNPWRVPGPSWFAPTTEEKRAWFMARLQSDSFDAVDVSEVRWTDVRWDFENHNRLTVALHDLGWSIGRRESRVETEHRKTQLLWQMWIRGVRRIDRAALQAHLEESGSPEAWDWAREAEQKESEIEKLRSDLHRGTSRRGSRSGKPYSAAMKRTLAKKIQSLEFGKACAEWQAEDVVPWAQENRLRSALGCLPRWLWAERTCRTEQARCTRGGRTPAA